MSSGSRSDPNQPTGVTRHRRICTGSGHCSNASPTRRLSRSCAIPCDVYLSLASLAVVRRHHVGDRSLHRPQREESPGLDPGVSFRPAACRPVRRSRFRRRGDATPALRRHRRAVRHAARLTVDGLRRTRIPIPLLRRSSGKNAASDEPGGFVKTSGSDAFDRGARRDMSDRWRLVLLSFVMLFVELALIRWAGSNVLYLSYFSNFVLLGSFLGIGIGFLRARSSRDLFPYAPLALAALVAFVRFFPVSIRSSGADLLFFGIVQAQRTAALRGARGRVHRGHRRDGVRRRRRRARVREVRAPRRVPARSARQRRRNRRVQRALVPRTRRPSRGASSLPSRSSRCTSRASASLQIAGLVVLVAILGAESFAAGASWSPYYKIEVKQDANLHSPDRLGQRGAAPGDPPDLAEGRRSSTPRSTTASPTPISTTC